MVITTKKKRTSTQQPWGASIIQQEVHGGRKRATSLVPSLHYYHKVTPLGASIVSLVDGTAQAVPAGGRLRRRFTPIWPNVLRFRHINSCVVSYPTEHSWLLVIMWMMGVWLDSRGWFDVRLWNYSKILIVHIHGWLATRQLRVTEQQFERSTRETCSSTCSTSVRVRTYPHPHSELLLQYSNTQQEACLLVRTTIGPRLAALLGQNISA